MIGIIAALAVGAIAGFIVCALIVQAKIAEMEIEVERARWERDRCIDTLEAIANRMGVCALEDVAAAARTALAEVRAAEQVSGNSGEVKP